MLVPILLGAALGNVVCRVPLDATGYFNIPLFTSFGTTNPVGILDWYTVLMGLFVLVAIAGHGATFLAWKTDGLVLARALKAGLPLWGFVVLLWIVLTTATLKVSPAVFHGWTASPLAWLATLIYIAGMEAVFFGLLKGRCMLAF